MIDEATILSRENIMTVMGQKNYWNKEIRVNILQGH